MRTSTRESGFTIAEVMVAMAGSIVVIGALMAGSIGLQRSFHASETFANTQADERRLLDYVARDLRRSIGIATCATGGVPVKLSSGSIELDGNTTLIITLPAYYQSDAREDRAYDQALAVIASGDHVAYGTEAGPASAVTVSFRQCFIPGEGSVCFIREEGDTRQVIVRGAADLRLHVKIAPDGGSATVSAEFTSRFSREGAVVAVHDRVMLRNARID